jgi:hypothetical protein
VIFDRGDKSIGVIAEVLHGETRNICGAPVRVLCKCREEILDGCGAACLWLPSHEHLELLAFNSVWDVRAGLLCMLDVLRIRE